MKRILFLILSLSLTSGWAQAPHQLNSAEIHEAIQKLNFLGSVLYVAAHPDDENTRLISYFANEVHARTGYLSITRGDGGQNLLGTELKELLGVIRTQELLAARDIDGGEQFFTRANDFGYTKTPDETLQIWDREKVLSDVVWTFRNFQPDVIIDRFNHRTSGDTHGQHTSSAILSVEAFDMAKDPEAFPEQLKLTETYTPKGLFFNTSPWFYGSQEDFDKADKTNFVKMETGVFFPSKGLSNPEIAALSRSNHKSQGFGSSGSRGSQVEYVELIKGELPANAKSVFSGIDTTWNRLKNGAPIGKILASVSSEYKFSDPSASLPKLLEAYNLIQNLPDSYWKKVKMEDIKEVIIACSGLYLEALAENTQSTPGEKISVNLEAINRSNSEVKLESLTILPSEEKMEFATNLANNSDWQKQISITIPKNINYTTPYWLTNSGSVGMYEVKNQPNIGKPVTPAQLKVSFNLNISGTSIPVERNIVYKSTDPVQGEIYQPFEILPPVTASFKDKVNIYTSDSIQNIQVTLTSAKENVNGKISLQASPNWKITPANMDYVLAQKGDSKTFTFKIEPPKDQDQSDLKPVVSYNGTDYSEEIVTIDYDHIPLQTLVLPSSSKLVKLDIKTKGKNLAYINGAGDVIPESLRQIGYKVTSLDPAFITAASLQKYDALIVGIRAYNTVDALKSKQKEINSYVENGGNVIVQYNNDRGLVTQDLAPFKLSLSRDRVTEEDAEVRFLAPENPVLNTPNKITSKDFNNWVQERGLYFPNSWGKEFTPILSMNDQNEAPMDGSLLVAPFGKGNYIYTGLSFFRQFPEGVPGAYRLFANLISLGK